MARFPGVILGAIGVAAVLILVAVVGLSITATPTSPPRTLPAGSAVAGAPESAAPTSRDPTGSPASTPGTTASPSITPPTSPSSRPTLTPAPAFTPAPSASPTDATPPSEPPEPTIRVVRESRISRIGGSCPGAFEPTVATHPTDPNRIAVAYQGYRFSGGRCHLDSVVAVSHDRGRTWRIGARRPWIGSGRAPDHHAVIAWGPGPRSGSARLYWANMTVAGPSGGHLVSVAWSDNEGATWSRLYVERRTPPWVGGFPDITVDRNPASPNYGVVYVAYNWLADARRGPGLHVLASKDFGRTWRATEVPAARGPTGFPDAWRIAYRIRTAPDGAAYVSSYQADLRAWNSAHIFRKGGLDNVGRVGFTVTRLRFDRTTGRFARGPTVMAAVLPRNAYTVSGQLAPGTSGQVYVDPMWTQGLDVDPATGRVLLAIGEFRAASRSGAPRGRIRVGRSDDGGRTWSWMTLPALPDVGGRPQSSYRPSLVVADGFVFVGFHGITDVPGGTSPSRRIPTIGTAFAVSADGGRTFAAPTPVSRVRWNAAVLATAQTGPGLRERAEGTADGSVFFAYGDGRLSSPPPSSTAGRSAVYGTLIELETAGLGPPIAAVGR